MLILFEDSTPAPLRLFLKEHVVVEAVDKGWERLSTELFWHLRRQKDFRSS